MIIHGLPDCRSSAIIDATGLAVALIGDTIGVNLFVVGYAAQKGLLPVAIGYGVDPVHLGIIFLANMQIGYVTPPVGMNLFIAGYRFEKPIDELYRAALPFMLVLFAAVLIITYWPGLSLIFLK